MDGLETDKQAYWGECLTGEQTDRQIERRIDRCTEGKRGRQCTHIDLYW